MLKVVWLEFTSILELNHGWWILGQFCFVSVVVVFFCTFLCFCLLFSYSFQFNILIRFNLTIGDNTYVTAYQFRDVCFLYLSRILFCFVYLPKVAHLCKSHTYANWHTYANVCTYAKFRTYPKLPTFGKCGGNLTLPRELKVFKATNPS